MQTEAELQKEDFWDLVRQIGDEFQKGMTKQEIIRKILGGKEIIGGDKICYVSDPIEYLKRCYSDLNSGGSLKLSVPTHFELHASDPASKTYFGQEYFTFFHRPSPNWQGVGNSRGYPGFKQLKQAQIGHTKMVELIK